MIVGVVRIDPDVLIIVAAGRAAKRCPRLAAVGRFPADDARGINNVRVFRIESHHRQIAAADRRSRPRDRSWPRTNFPRRRPIDKVPRSFSVATAANRLLGELGAIARFACTIASGRPFAQLVPGLAAIGRFENSAVAAVPARHFPRDPRALPKAKRKRCPDWPDRSAHRRHRCSRLCKEPSRKSSRRRVERKMPRSSFGP